MFSRKILTSLYSSFGENKDNTDGEIVIIEKDEEDTSNLKITEQIVDSRPLCLMLVGCCKYS